MKLEPINGHPALLIIDMVKDNFDESRNLPITPLARRIIEPINRLKKAFRTHGWPVVFSTDAFGRGDFIFSGRMKPHSLEGTEGARVIDELGCGEADLWLPKPRFSAFFRTPLDGWLKERGVTLCAVAGIATNYCVLTTALDSICCDFRTVILEDCTAAISEGIHAETLNLYRRGALHPLLRVVSSRDLLSELEDG
ncbi:MAG: cysteine hydrolase [Deltaproteobacteria bacterium]|nr:cysteine hydrolase [Deltaproteobacteria bacterium]